MKSAAIERPYVILEKHLDTFGHVNNAEYFRICEEMRWELLFTIGYSLSDVWTLQKGPTILEAHIRFKKELKLRQKIKIRTEFFDYDKKVYRIEQSFFTEEGALAAEGKFTGAFFDMKTRKIIPPTDKWLQGFNTLSKG